MKKLRLITGVICLQFAILTLIDVCNCRGQKSIDTGYSQNLHYLIVENVTSLPLSCLYIVKQEYQGPANIGFSGLDYSPLIARLPKKIRISFGGATIFFRRGDTIFPLCYRERKKLTGMIPATSLCIGKTF